MARVHRLTVFPKEHVWIPTKDGKFAHRPLTENDKDRRSCLLSLFAANSTEAKEHYRDLINDLPWPCHEQHEDTVL